MIGFYICSGFFVVWLIIFLLCLCSVIHIPCSLLLAPLWVIIMWFIMEYKLMKNKQRNYHD
jgi:hypothetical protein